MADISKSVPFDRSQFEELMKKRFFFSPSFQIYGGISGLFDYGPPGSALQTNIVDLWRKHFVIEESMLEVDCSMLTPHDVLKTSGHVDKFCDWMCKDPTTGEIFRADHLVEEVLEARLKGDKEARAKEAGATNAPVQEESDDKKKRKKKVKEIKVTRLDDEIVREYEFILAQIDNYDGQQLGEIMKIHDIRNPANNGELESPRQFNLMFQTQIGPSGGLQGYLRPETAQGQFLNFNRLLEFNNGKVPFASAMVGKAFRNEISPRSGLLRVREFLMGEVEHFVDPQNKQHDRFDEVAHIPLRLLPRGVQLEGKSDVLEITIGDAVEKGIVDNTTLGYFMARISLFLEKIGIDMSRLRFRQHMSNEMAHYACDCWDAEIQCSYGWIECVGCADRSAYDLTVHSKATKTPLVVQEALPEPIVVEEYVVEVNKKKFGPRFKRDAKAVEEEMLNWSQEIKEVKSAHLASQGKITVAANGVEHEVDAELVTIEKQQRKEHTRTFTPNVIEPSFGLGRLLYCLMEHSFWARPEDTQRGVLSFPAVVAPIKALIVPLSRNAEFNPVVRQLSAKLRSLGVSNKVDDSNANIGRRYARNDELGTPFGLTVDFETLENGSITLRERDTTKQVRGSQEDIINALVALTEGKMLWTNAVEKFGEFNATQE
ncbi:cytoplasmic glycine-tRNA ligase Grs1 [Schizosaccharomyces cryophilus OY26]|uniref:glycine--tRNA ligase n=1 Tax=Schizosaccharomyces cryophilus (strain OY26 / ATCC MYA-4695 / CBS 11777 / NBRC 106824 / NRRL Y48691) TaxID=653667 RepID=S9W5I3_SCHCR|nr:cytoplasmic glycine-tRNA ligase Grs1 [Schizosaccharomyces cryophilus OY26]EPY53235.1 cytoplasmic glycine-tRNA ligase Grs1 [Schizosaccharomyces cryophilus OY26]